MFDLKPEAYGI